MGMVSTDFFSNFDEEGQYRNRDGVLEVTFATRGGGRFPGRLQFSNGLCIRAEMEGGGDWVSPNDSPLNGIKFLLDLGDENPQSIAIDQGRIVRLGEIRRHSKKQDFLTNFRVARNLFAHHAQVQADSANITAAIWLTPKSVAGFDAADFPELGPDGRGELGVAVRDFLKVATEVPADKPASKEQYEDAKVAFMKLLDLLKPYLPIADEAKKVEAALRNVDFPVWVVNWDYELGSDSDGAEAVWVDVFADEQSVPRQQLGRAAAELSTRIRQALSDRAVDRWPYIRMRTAAEHKTGVR